MIALDTRYTMPDNLGAVTLIDVMPHPSVLNADTRVVQAARISTNRGSKGEIQDARLIDYMLANGHTSPFEMVELAFLIECPLFVRAQWMRHRTWNFNEFSRRYSSENVEFWQPGQLYQQSKQNHQARQETPVSLGDFQDFQTRWQTIMADADTLYADMIASGVAREQARFILPQGLLTKFFAKTDLHNLLHFIGLRHHEHAQPEIRVYAYTLWRIVQAYAPLTAEAYAVHKMSSEQQAYRHAFIDAQFKG